MRCLVVLLLTLALCSVPAQASATRTPVTRGEFALLLWESAGGVPFDCTAHPFTDLQGREELAQAVAWAYQEGLIRGVGGDRFAPDRFLTREECALLLRRNDALLGRDTWLADGAAACNDYADISPWADDSLYWACITGRMTWRNGRLAPTGTVYRDEARFFFSPEGTGFSPGR